MVLGREGTLGVKRVYPAAPLPAVGGVVFHENEVLLVQRGKPPADRVWTLPGGMVELGEGVGDALRRELREECHLDVVPRVVLGVFEPIVRDADGKVRYHYVVVDLLAELAGPADALYRGDDARAARWVPLDQLDAYGVPAAARQIIDRGVAVVAGNNFGCPLLNP